MMGTMHRADGSVSQTVHGQDAYSQARSGESHTLRAAATRTPVSLVERFRTFVDRTLDAAFGRYDH